MLNESVPPPDMACLDASCGDEVNISIDELFNNPPILMQQIGMLWQII